MQNAAVPTAEQFIAAVVGNGKDWSGITLSVVHGRKYNKIVSSHGGQRSAWAFMDQEGNIYKPASWKTPAKGVRFTAEQFAAAVERADRFGGFLYR